MNVEDMQARLDMLAEGMACRLDQEPNMAGMMYVEFGYVEGPTLDSSHYPNPQCCYLVCLHELGHFWHSHTQGRPWTDLYAEKAHMDYSPEWWENENISTKSYFNNGVLRSEAQAWNYALDKCDLGADILPETRAFMWDNCLGTYFNHARQVGFDTPGQLLYNGDRAYVHFAYGKPDKYFFQTKRRILEGDIEEDLPTTKPRWAEEAANNAWLSLDQYQATFNTAISQTGGTNTIITYGPYNVVRGN